MHALDDLEGAEFGDRRLSKRLLRLVARLTVDPSASFLAAMRGAAELEGTYRFLNNEDVTPERIIAPHVMATVERAKAAHRVIVAHDTTSFSFSSEREGLGRINEGGRGFFAHTALVVSADGMRRPLGVVGLQSYTRRAPAKRDKHTERIPYEERESFRWKSLAEEAGRQLEQVPEVVHVMDSEADSYELVRELLDHGLRFAIRLTHDRKVRDESGDKIRLSRAVAQLKGRFVREVQLSARAAPHHEKRGRKRNGNRNTREATLAFSAGKFTIMAPKTVRSERRDLCVHIVSVSEVDAPAGCEPVSWLLVTSEPIQSAEDIERIVDAYRARWVIEEFFKALKTGCAFEKRQLESLAALLNALAVFVPIAFELLALRAQSRTEPDTPASQLLRPLQLLVLQRHPDTQLPADASAHMALLAIAKMGGHIKNNGDPGWLVLGRGYQTLLTLEQGAAAMM